MLLAAGYTITEIADASVDAHDIKHERLESMDTTSQNWDRVSFNDGK